jgi:hypothetical protein
VTSRWKKAGETFEHVVPALRIIDDGTWKEANRLLSQGTRLYLRRTDGRLWGKPAAGVDSPYLMTGLLACGMCGSVMGAESRPTGDSGKRLRVYWCRSNRHGRRMRGDVCVNNIVVPMRLLDDAVLACIEPYLTPDVIADAVERCPRPNLRSEDFPDPRTQGTQADLSPSQPKRFRLAGYLPGSASYGVFW